MLGAKILKSEFNPDEYAKLVTWCNSQEYKTIEDKGEYYEVVDCSPTQEELNFVKKKQLLVQLQDVNNQIKELNVAVMFDSGDDTTDVIIDGNVLTMTSDELRSYHAEIMNLRSDILNRIKELE